MFNGLSCWHPKHVLEKKKSHACNALIWLLQNQNRKTSIVPTPANYHILIIAIFTPPSVVTTPSYSVTVWELTHYKLSPECLLLTTYLYSESTVLRAEAARKIKASLAVVLVCVYFMSSLHRR